MTLIAANDNQPVRYGPWLPTKALALLHGANTYFNGNPCLRGHTSPRAVSSRNCVACLYEDGVARRQSPDSADKVRAYHREYGRKRKAADPVFAARVKELSAKGEARPGRKEQQNEARRKRLIARPELRIKYNEQAKPSRKAWKAANKDAVAHQGRMRRAKKNGADGEHTLDDLATILELQGGACACCIEIMASPTVDHIVPLNSGGTNWPSNIQMMCLPCNSAKRDYENQFAIDRRRAVLGIATPIDFVEFADRPLPPAWADLPRRWPANDNDSNLPEAKRA